MVFMIVKVCKPLLFVFKIAAQLPLLEIKIIKKRMNFE